MAIDGLPSAPPRGGERRGVLSVVAVILLVALGAPGLLSTTAQAADNPLEPLDTSSPQATYLSFVAQVEVLEELLLSYEANRTAANQAAFSSALAKTEELFELSEVASANRNEAEVAAFANLADILNRLPPPDVEEIPDADDVEESTRTEVRAPSEDEAPLVRSVGIERYTLPGTEITITLIDDGSRAGDYLFSADTVAQLPTWREEVDGLPVNDGVVVRDWVHEESAFTGHLVPRSLVDALPDGLDRDFLGSPTWKVVTDIVILGLVGLVVWLWHRWVGRRGQPGTARGYLFRLSTPILTMLLVTAARRFMNEQVNHSGEIATAVNLLVTFVIWGSFAWAFWIATKLIVEWIIATPTISDESVDAHLLRLVAKVVSVAGAFSIAWVGLSRLGVPTVGLGIGAGVVGLAVALAATSTLENLLGGITVYADKPFAVGDRIRVDDDFGTVEEIGPRSTRIRRLDDTKVNLPNADVSRAKVTNYSERRHILFVHLIGVRYETTVAQLRTIVNAIDARLREHPRVLDEIDFPRVRVFGFGASSIDIEVRAHVDTQDYSEFTGVQQELLMLIYEIVEAAGSGFAFPSSTTYLANDSGLPEPLESALIDSATTPGPVPVRTAPNAPHDDDVTADAIDE